MDTLLSNEKTSADCSSMTTDHREPGWKLWNMRIKRDMAVSSISNWEELRDHASEIRLHTLSNLDHYLDMFETKARQNGITIHWAKDAQEHNSIIYSLLRKNDVTTAVKSRSSLHYECELTPYLQDRGIIVTETGIGDRIQQLDQQPPSHLTIPSIRKNFKDISKVLSDKLNIDKNDIQPKSIAENIRENLRPRFISAEAGLTGANFAVAETGSLVICSNEGNTELCSTLPDLHIISMGIEKIIPNMDDLHIFMKLLSPSAYGNTATRFTTHIHQPLPGKQMHVVITDNGRSEKLGKSDFWTSLKCIKCGACLNACPVYSRFGEMALRDIYPAPLDTVLDPGFDPQDSGLSPFLSILCGACTDVCPVKIDIDTQILKWRKIAADYETRLGAVQNDMEYETCTGCLSK